MFGGSPAFLGYLLVFVIAAVGCLGSIAKARRVEDAETRFGLVALLGFSGGWAAFQVFFLLAPSPGLKYSAYLASLVVGLATVGAWLYFCSAYTGRTFHRDPTYRRLAAGVYGLVVAVKLTNPVHGLYFSTRLVQEPFVHMTIRHGTLHWIVTGLSYALVAVGLFMLFELFLEADYDTSPLGALVVVTALPAVFDVVGYATPLLLDLNHESLGVAVFAVGVLFAFDERFLSVQVTGDVDDPVVFLDDDDGRVRDYNDMAADVFPELAGSRGDPLSETVPGAVEAARSADGVFERREGGETRYYLVGESAFTLGQTDVGEVYVFADVTATERRRRELERQNDQLQGLAEAMRHELRNTLQVVRGRVAVAGEALESGDVTLARESFETATDTADRMERIVDDLSALAQYGQTVEETQWVRLSDAAREAAAAVEGDLSVEVSRDGDIDGEESRLVEILGDAFQFARHNGASTVTVSTREEGFTMTGDGDPPGDVDPAAYFQYSGAVPHAQAGVALPNLRTLAGVHGWSADIDDDYDDGVRIEVTGVRTRATRPAEN